MDRLASGLELFFQKWMVWGLKVVLNAGKVLGAESGFHVAGLGRAAEGRVAGVVGLVAGEEVLGGNKGGVSLDREDFGLLVEVGDGGHQGVTCRGAQGRVLDLLKSRDTAGAGRLGPDGCRVLHDDSDKGSVRQE